MYSITKYNHTNNYLLKPVNNANVVKVNRTNIQNIFNEMNEMYLMDC